MKIAIFIVMTVEQNFGETWNDSFVSTVILDNGPFKTKPQVLHMNTITL
jgi:hypothetical protein